ncbi:tachykinin-like peptides receptor 86C [Oculina patagonica]
MNNTSLDLSQTEESSLTAQDIVFAVLYSAIVVPGVVGNGVIITIVRKTPSMHTATNYLLMNLAVADLLTLLLCPGLYDFALTKVRLQGLTGDLVCKLFAGNAVVPITINVAVVTVCTIAVERYLALVKPFRNIRLTKESVRYVIAVLWLLALLSCIPDIQANTYDIASSKYPCKRPWSLDEYFLHKPFIIFTCVGFGVISSLILFICYFEIIRGLYFTRTICSESSVTEAERQAKKQLARLVIWLAVLFAACSLPFAVYFLFLVSADIKTVQDNYETLFVLHRVSRFLLFANSFFNPLLYAFQSSNYRDGFKSIFNCRVHCCGLFVKNSVQDISLNQAGVTVQRSTNEAFVLS